MLKILEIKGWIYLDPNAKIIKTKRNPVKKHLTGFDISCFLLYYGVEVTSSNQSGVLPTGETGAFLFALNSSGG